MTPFDVIRAGTAERPVLRVRGELDMATAERLERAGRDVPATGVLVIDLRDLDYIDSSGIRVLLTLERERRDAGGRIEVVTSRSGQVQRVLEMVDLADSVEVRGAVASDDDAPATTTDGAPAGG